MPVDPNPHNWKSTWWSVVSFKEEEIRLMQGPEYPEFVERVIGGLEECPTTKRLHFQGALKCRRQMRMKQIKDWLPTSKLEIARQPEALKKYCMKEETAVGAKKEVVNSTPHVTVRKVMEELSLVYDQLNIAQHVNTLVKESGFTVKKAQQDGYWRCVRHLVQYYEWARDCCHLFARADVKELYFNTRSVWVCPRGVSITHPEGCQISENPGGKIVELKVITEDACQTSICSQEENDSP